MGEALIGKCQILAHHGVLRIRVSSESLLHRVPAVAADFFSLEVARNCSVQGENMAAAFFKKSCLLNSSGAWEAGGEVI